jgi:hypothetical protein
LTDQLERSDARIALQRLLPAQTVVGLEREGVLDQSPSEPVRETLRCWLQSPAVADAVIREVISSRQLLMHYLGASGFAPGARCALVDAGWRGTLQKCLARAYAPLAGNAQIEAFYIGLRHRVPLEPGSAMHAFLPDRQVQQYGYALVSLIEGFLSANHGTTLGYRETNIGGGVEPILGRPPIDALLTQWSTVRESCLVYAREFVASSAFSAQAGILAYALAAPLLTLCTRPTPADAAALRNWRIDVGRDEPRIKALAKSLSAVDIAKLVLARARGTAEGDIYLSGPWLRGSIAASRAPLRQFASLLLPRQDAST